MCGITGFVRLRPDAPFPERERIERATAALAHRGPDGAGVMYDPRAGIALGHRRLAIIDVDGGSQPMTARDGRLQIVFNGEIYNFRELRAELASSGFTFHTRSDTEVLLRGYEAWGLDALRRLNGIFGLAIWDADQSRLLLARDPAGVKPVYYRELDGVLHFASEIRGLPPSRELDVQALGRFLAFRYVPSPATLLSGVRRLPPGHRLMVTAGRMEMADYAPPPPALQTVRSERDLVTAFSSHLAAAVQRQMISDVPVGALLSGGLDSAVIVHHMTRAGGPVRTFTVGFEDDGAASELPAARAMANRLGTEHVEVRIPTTDFRAFLPRALAQVEEPISSSSALALYYICREARRHVKVVLTGQGADEPMGGYDRYRGERYAHLMRWIPRWLREGVALPAVRALTRSEKARRALCALGESDPARRFVRIYDVFPEGFARTLVRPEWHAAAFAESPVSVVEHQRAAAAALPPLIQLMNIDRRMWLPDDLLLYGDKMSMAHGLELRVPFLDLELLAFLESVPPAYRIRRLRGKHLLKTAALQWFPRDFVDRPKQGFAPPVETWFRTSLRDHLRESLLAADAATRPWLQPAPIERLLEDHARGAADHHRALFTLFSLELWARQCLGGGGA